MRIIGLVVFQHHIGLICYACILFVFAVLAIVGIEARRRHNKAKKYSRICNFCAKGEIAYRYVRVKLSPDRSGNYLTFLFSMQDYLCQTQGVCQNLGCSHKSLCDWGNVRRGDNMPIEITSDVRTWGFRSKIVRLRQLSVTVGPERLIQTGKVKMILHERGIIKKPVKPNTGFEKPPFPGVRTQFSDISPKSLFGSRVPEEHPLRK